MTEDFFSDLNEQGLFEMLAALEGMDVALEEQERLLKEGSDDNENEL